MPEQDQPQGILNNAIVGLLILFTIPLLLVVGGFFVIALQGRIPGGVTSTCTRDIGNVTFQIEIYAYTAGLTPYETQTIRVNDAEQFADTIQAPQPATCADNIRVIGDSILIYTQKSLARINRDGTRDSLHNICDDPRPSRRCDSDTVNFAQIIFTDDNNGRILVQESVVDEYGQPLFENGEPLIIAQYELLTRDGGITWQMREIE